jgi:ABC-type transport system involved in cytochrome bd biosynthesis fused ATPase/permease subunit
VMDHGVIVERGSHSELLANGKRYMELWRQQSDDAGRYGKPNHPKIAQTLET